MARSFCRSRFSGVWTACWKPTKDAVLKEKEKREAAGLNPEPFLLKKSGQLFYNTSPLDMKKLMGDQDNIRENLFCLRPGVFASSA
jgi:hypothetical protein